MSWSVSFTAKGKRAAKRQAQTYSGLPTIVRALIESAVDGIHGCDSAPIHVEGNGHHAEGDGSYNVTTCNLTVKPLTLTE